MIRKITALLLLLTGTLHAWSGKEHIQLTRLAAERLIADPATPPAMKTWLIDIIPQRMSLEEEEQFLLKSHVGAGMENVPGGVLRWAVMPDYHALNDPRTQKVQPFEQHERLMHYIDLELLVVGDKKREYRDDLSAKPLIENIRHDWRDERYIQAGYLPFAVENSYRQLVQAIRAGNLKSAEGIKEEDDQSAMRWAGYLAHYAEDNTQPQHATIDYKSQSYFKNARRAPNVHAEMEYRLLDDADEEFPELRKLYWAEFTRALKENGDPIKSDDPWMATVQVSLTSYDALPLVGRAAQQALVPAPSEKADKVDTAKFMAFRGNFAGQELSVLQLKARQTAWAVKRVQRLWLAAWNEAQLPAKSSQ